MSAYNRLVYGNSRISIDNAQKSSHTLLVAYQARKEKKKAKKKSNQNPKLTSEGQPPATTTSPRPKNYQQEKQDQHNQALPPKSKLHPTRNQAA